MPPTLSDPLLSGVAAAGPSVMEGRPMSDIPLRLATVTVRSPEGLHLRPLTQLAKLAQSFSSEIILRKAGVFANAKHPLDLMALGAACGERLELEVRGDDAEAAADAVVSFFDADPGDGI
jgi:phosphotransferase system HPr (HPr) family protein